MYHREKQGSYNQNNSNNKYIVLTECKYNLNQHDSHFGRRVHLRNFRFVMMLWFTAEWVNILVQTGIPAAFKQFYAQTMISLLVTWIYFLGICIFGQTSNHKRYHSFFTTLSFCITTIEAIVSLFFWIFLFPQTLETWDSIQPLDHWGNFTWHSIPIISLTIDAFWSKFHFRKKILCVPIIFGICYQIENATLAIRFNIIVYPILNYKDYGTYIYIAICLFLLVGFGVLMICLKSKLNKRMEFKVQLENERKFLNRMSSSDEYT